MLSREQLQSAAAAAGYAVEPFEKVYTLLRVLDALRAHPYLATRLALKGGTALNVFVLDLPRLSVDIDLNYVGAVDRATMLAERPDVERALEQVFGRVGLTVRRVPSEHAGGKWRLSYTTALGRPGAIEVDLNFILRAPLWPTVLRDARLADATATGVRVLDDHELAAGKLAALLARSASRDLFDARALLTRPGWDRRRLRLGFVVYGGINRVDWRSVTPENVRTTPEDVWTQLAPMLHERLRPTRAEVPAWTDALVGEVRQLLSEVLPLGPAEGEFLERLNGAGEIVPELLTADAAEQHIFRTHPGLTWKALNVRKQLGSG